MMDRLAHQVLTRWVLANSPKLLCIRLDPSSQQGLKSWWQHKIGPLLRDHYLDHVTLVYRPTPEDLEGVEIGQVVSFHVVGWNESESVQAVKVQIPSHLKVQTGVPHVTISTNGVRPVASIALLKEHVEPVHGPTLRGRVEVEV